MRVLRVFDPPLMRRVLRRLDRIAMISLRSWASCSCRRRYSQPRQSWQERHTPTTAGWQRAAALASELAVAETVASPRWPSSLSCRLPHPPPLLRRPPGHRSMQRDDSSCRNAFVRQNANASSPWRKTTPEPHRCASWLAQRRFLPRRASQAWSKILVIVQPVAALMIATVTMDVPATAAAPTATFVPVDVAAGVAGPDAAAVAGAATTRWIGSFSGGCSCKFSCGGGAFGAAAGPLKRGGLDAGCEGPDTSAPLLAELLVREKTSSTENSGTDNAERHLRSSRHRRRCGRGTHACGRGAHVLVGRRHGRRSHQLTLR